MSADPVGEPVRGTDDDVLGRLAAIDQRLHQISTQLTTMGQSFSQLDKISANLETLIGSLGSAGRRVGRPVPSPRNESAGLPDG